MARLQGKPVPWSSFRDTDNPLAAPSSRVPHIFLLLLLLLSAHACSACTGSDCAVSGGWDNFANNLGTDLAPLLALFGEQVTKQFMSESLSWVDSLLFCLAPLGVITAMIAAIRVAGSPGLRALIGRAKESRGEVEADLMSSTSADVCELWNGEGVVRVLGRPVLLQMVRVKEDENTSQIYTFKDAIVEGLYKEKGSLGGSKVEEQLNGQNPPNLSLNVNMVALPRWVIVVFIGIGVVLQGGVLVYSAVVQYALKLSKNDELVSSYGFPLFAAGTLFLALGMFLCAEVVESSTDEITWVPTKPATTSIIWLQQGGQTVGDQRFESFARCTASNEITTSNKSTRTGRTSLVLLSVGFALVGFVAQFIALRAMHATVTVVQLGAVLVMTAIRSCAHIQRDGKNDIEHPEQVEGHELDWLAKNLHACVGWEVVAGPVMQEAEENENTPLLGAARSISPKPGRWSFLGRVANRDQKASLSPPGSSNSSINTIDLAITVMRTRAHLAELSKDWVLQLRDTVARLQRTLDLTMNEIYGTITLNDGWKSKDSFQWSLPVKVQLSDGSTKQLFARLTMTRDRDQNEQWRPWVSKRCDLEAVMSLWVSTLAEENRVRGPVKNVRYLGLATPEAVKDYRSWIHRQTAPDTAPLSPTARYFGYLDLVPLVDNTIQHLCVPSETELDLLCAQHIYTVFMSTIASEIQSIGGTTERRLTEATSEGNLPIWMHFRLSNTKLAALATIYFEAGLGTIEEAYFSIFPAFKTAGIIPSAREACREARQAAKNCQLRGDWVQALGIDGWLCENKESTEFDEGEVAVMFAEAEQRLLRLMAYIDGAHDPGKKGELWEGFLVKIWDAASMLKRGRTAPTPYSHTLAWCVVWLCKNTARFTTGIDSSEVFKMAAEILQTMDLRQQHQLQLVLRFIREALEKTQDTEAETLATLVWNATASATASFIASQTLEKNKDPSEEIFEVQNWQATTSDTDNDPVAANFAASQALLSLRQKRGLFMGIEDMRRYLADPVAHDNRQDDPITIDILNSSSISVDLQLIRLYRTPLQSAAEAGRLDIVRLLLSSDPEAINAAPISSHGRTALQATAGQGHYAVAEHLLSSSADIHYPAAPHFGRTALQAAAEGGHASIVQLLLTHNALPNEPPAPCTDLCTNFRRRLIPGLPEITGDTNLYTPAHTLHTTHLGVSALHAAAANGHENIIELLLAAGANVNDSSHGTALQAAAAAGHLPVVEKLLAADADVNIDTVSCGGRTALQAAAEAGHIDIVQLLLRHSAAVNAPPAPYHGRTALAAAAGFGLLSIVKLLLDEDAVIDAPPGASFGATALQAAARGGHTRVVEMLLEAGADFNASPALIGGCTALTAAAGAGHAETVEALLKYAVNINAPAPYAGRTALQAAAEGGYRRVVEILLRERAEVNAAAAPGGGRTALVAAAGGGHSEVVKVLLRAKADVNAGMLEVYGHAGLEEAAGGGLLSTVEMWLRDFQPIKKHGITPLGAAASKGYAGIMEMLLKEGARVIIPAAERHAPSDKQITMMLELQKRSLGFYTNERGKQGVINPPLEEGDKATLSKMHGWILKCIFSAEGTPGYTGEETPIGLARTAGYTDILKMLELAGEKERPTKNEV